MERDHSIQPLKSALQQAGVETSVFKKNTLSIREVAGTTIVRVHSFRSVHELEAAVIDLPTKTGQCSNGNSTTLCTRPREWLYISETLVPSELMGQIRSTPELRGSAITDVSDGLAVFQLSGEGASWLLSKLSCVNYLSNHYSGQYCVRTKMGHAAVIVHHHEADDGQFVFDLILDRSLTRYLWSVLMESAPHADGLALEFGRVE